MSKNDIRVQLIQKSVNENVSLDVDASYTNFFLVKLPEEIDVKSSDILSFEYLDNKTCRIVIRDNFTTFPLIKLTEYKKKYKNIFLPKKDNLIIEYFDKKGVIKYSVILTKMSIKTIKEDVLTYYRNDFHTLSIDINYKKRILEK